MLFESNFFVNALRPEKVVHHFKFKTIRKRYSEFTELYDIKTAIIVSSYQRTALHLAAREGRDDTVEYLVKQGANITKDKNGVCRCTIRTTDGRVLAATCRYICGSEYHFTTTMQTISKLCIRDPSYSSPNILNVSNIIFVVSFSVSDDSLALGS